MVESDISNIDNKEREFDSTIRKSKICRHEIIIDMKIDSNIKPSNEFEYIEYDKEGFFSVHVDRKRKENHTHTIILYPPQNITGGELVLYPYQTNIMNITIKPFAHKWIGAIIPINMYHESKPIISGKKIILKTIGLTY